MYFVMLGLALLLLRWLGVEPMAQWSAWSMFLPFIAAPVWWAWSDASGRTRRLQEDRIDERRRERRRKAIDALGPQDRDGKRRGR